jgi:hypothetical protein
MSMELAGVDFGVLSPDKLLHGVVAAVLYFVVGVAVLVVGFITIDVLPREACGERCSCSAAPTRW